MAVVFEPPNGIEVALEIGWTATSSHPSAPYRSIWMFKSSGKPVFVQCSAPNSTILYSHDSKAPSHVCWHERFRSPSPRSERFHFKSTRSRAWVQRLVRRVSVLYCGGRRRFEVFGGNRADHWTARLRCCTKPNANMFIGHICLVG